MAALRLRGAAAAALCVVAMAAAYADDDPTQMRPPCKMGMPGATSNTEGWTGPNCIAADSFGKPLPAALAAEKDRVDKAVKAKKAGATPEAAKPVCRMGMPGVTSTTRGWEGPGCIPGDSAGNPLK